MKTSELAGAALDWAVAKAEGAYQPSLDVFRDGSMLVNYGGMYPEWSTDWAEGGPIIEREGIAVDCIRSGGNIDSWQAGSMVAGDDNWDAGVQYGPTPLIAAMRCYVASKLGDEVEIPQELIE